MSQIPDPPAYKPDGGKHKSRKWVWAVLVLVIVLVAVLAGVVGTAIGRASHTSPEAGDKAAGTPTPTGLAQTKVPGARGCLGGDLVLADQLPTAQKKATAPPKTVGAAEFGGLMTQWIVTATTDDVKGLTRYDEFRPLFSGTPWDATDGKALVQYRNASEPGHDFAMTDARYWVTAANEKSVHLLVAGAYSQGSTDDRAREDRPAAGLDITLVPKNGHWAISKATAFNDQTDPDSFQQVFTSGERFTETCDS